MPWVDANCKYEDLCPEQKRNDTRALLCSCGANIGLQSWQRFVNVLGPCGVHVKIINREALIEFVFSSEKKSTYGPTNPVMEILMLNKTDVDRAKSEAGIDAISCDFDTHFVIIINLLSHNSIIIRKIPKSTKAMFGSEMNRDQYLSAIKALGPFPDEILVR